MTISYPDHAQYGNFKFNNLAYNTTYYTRVMSDFEGSWGVTRSFTTEAVPVVGSSVVTKFEDSVFGRQSATSNPTTFVNMKTIIKGVAGATMYTVEVNDDPTFTDTTNSQTASFADYTKYGNFHFTNMISGLQYYVRVWTDVENVWGPSIQFTPDSAAMARPADRFTNYSMSYESGIANYTVYPNPFTYKINLRVDSKKQDKLMVTVSDLTGKVVYQSTRHQTNQTIQLGNDLVDGMYLIQLVHGDDIKLIKAIKK